MEREKNHPFSTGDASCVYDVSVSKQVSKLVFYAQSTGAVISGRYVSVLQLKFSRKVK